MTKEDYFGTFCTADELPVHKERVAQIVEEAKKLEIEQLKDAYGDGINAHRTDFCNRDEYFDKVYRAV